VIALRFLAGTGSTVETAETGRLAVARHSQRPYDLILMDCHMPHMDGFEATAAIRALDQGADVPIVAVTASAFAEDRERCRRAGMNGYIAKPCDARNCSKRPPRPCGEGRMWGGLLPAAGLPAAFLPVQLESKLHLARRVVLP
jgi:CheY-like chemotaxis protein